jgi:hypothetical protein
MTNPILNAFSLDTLRMNTGPVVQDITRALSITQWVRETTKK